MTETYSEGIRPNLDYFSVRLRAEGDAANEATPKTTEIPPKMVVAPAAYRRFMSSNGLDDVVESLLEGINVTHEGDLQRATDQISYLINTSPIPEPLNCRIYEVFKRHGDGVISVWPVTRPKKEVRFSMGPSGSLYLEATNPAEVIGAVKTWWTSLFEPAAIFYRELHGSKHRDASIAIAVSKR